MGSIRQDDAEGTVKKKSKKRKNAESSTSRGEEGDMEVCDVDLTKKARAEFLVDNSASGAVAGANLNLDGCHSPRKEKKKKHRSSTHKQNNGSDNTRERKRNESKMEDEGGASSVLDASDERISGEPENGGFDDLRARTKEKLHDRSIDDGKTMKAKKKASVIKTDGGVATEIELLKEGEEHAREDKQVRKDKKKKKAKEPKSKEVDCVSEKDSAGSMRNQAESEVIEKFEPVVDKKKEKKKHKREEECDFVGEEQAREDGQAKKTKRTKSKEPETREVNCGSEIESAGADSMGNHIEPVVDKKKKKKKEKREEEGDFEGEEQVREDGQAKNEKKTKTKEPKSNKVDCASEKDSAMGEVIEPVVDKKKKKKKDKREEEHDLEGEEQAREDGQAKKNKKNTKTKEPKGKEVDCAGEKDSAASMGYQIEPTVDKKENKKKKKKKGVLAAGSLDKEPGNNSTDDGIEPSKQSASTKKLKKVTFSDHDEVVTLPDTTREKKKKRKCNDGDNENGIPNELVQGKRFTKEEDEIVKRAVLDYVEEHQLGEDGVDMIMKCKQYPELKGCWKEIGQALPYRPYMAVYYRAHILFEGGGHKKWTEEDLELVRKFHAEHGPDWKTLADELGTHRFHVKDAWRRIKLPNLKRGHWSQEEYQNLFTLVNVDLSMKIYQEKKSKYGMLRDNISWEAISDKLTTRSNAGCCVKWYDQLSSPMVAEGKWADSDDYRLLIALVDLDPSCEDEVDWDQLLDHRSGDVCRERWKQMVRHIGHYATKSFGEQIEILSVRYCPEILEAREAYENKPFVD